MKKVIAIGLYVPGTGFTRVLQSLFEELKHNFEIHWIGVGYTGPILDLGYKVYPNNLRGGDVYGAYFAEKLANEIDADCIFVLNDFWILKNYKKVFERLPKHIKKLAYVPLDGKINQPLDIKESAFLDHIVLYTNFAYLETKQAFAELIRAKEISHVPKLSKIPHGVDLTAFTETNKEIAKKLCFSNIPHVDQCIFFLNANRPSERKGVHLTIQAFAKSINKLDHKTYLVLHHGGIDSPEKQSCMELIESLGIRKNVIIDPLNKEGYVKDEELNLLYNACDIGVNSSYGEGWGLIAFEHAATGAAQIVPNHTACSEIWKEVALLTKTIRDLHFPTNPFQMSEISVDELSRQMIRLCNDMKLRKLKGNQCKENSMKKKYQWSRIANSWSAIL